MALHYVIRADDREVFQRCRRAWDFGARERGDREPVRPERVVELDRAIADALAIYYFPGMWDWRPAIVLPLVRKAFLDSLNEQRSDYLTAHGLVELPGSAERAFDDTRQLGSHLLERYFEWAPSADDFSPAVVTTEIDVQVPDPARPGRDLVSADGRAVHFRDRVDLMAIDEDQGYWVLQHRLVRGPWPDLDLLRLSERCLSWAWAWELDRPGMRIEGTIFNELHVTGDDGSGEARPPGEVGGSGEPTRRGSVAQHDETYQRPWSNPARGESEPAFDIRVQLGDGFRRVRVPRGRAELAEFGVRLAAQAAEMVDPQLAPYPNPSVAYCAKCAFRAPCIALNSGGEATEILATGYRARSDNERPGRLGTTTWSTGRGAAPPDFGRGRD